MKQDIRNGWGTGASVADPAFRLRRFVEAHNQALMNGAYLLGGDEGLRLANRLCERIGSEMVLSRTTERLLRATLDLLLLQNVHDPYRAESGFFAAIEPCDPVVEECCLLADDLRDAIRDWERMRRGHSGKSSHLTAA